MSYLQTFIRNLFYWLPALIIAMSFHEYAHGKAADMLGDPTPRYAGRLTLNPLRHVDPVGLLMLLIVKFGWAKPVHVNPLYFRGDRRRGMLLVAVAGPGMNFLLAVLAGIAWALSYVARVKLGWEIAVHAVIFFEYLMLYNVYLGVFNLLPIPPLDGSKILFNILPPRYSKFFYQIERYGFLILIVVLVTGLYQYFLTPVANWIFTGIFTLAGLILRLFLGGAA
ncbi:MAG: site-2 protease family protein [Eubacteriales bacterium]|mgnify:CR=1 FL=1|jgi:Zn-dependent protease|nr:site-2 protease family protein [Eubacteriales bacterium]